MNISEFFISRPVFATILNIFMMIAGIMCFNDLKVREYPSVTVASFDIKTYYPNASAIAVESSITNPLEDALAGLPGLENIRSKTRESNSDIKLRFKTGTNIDTAMSNIREYISRVELPDKVKPPRIERKSGQEDAFLYISLKSDVLNAQELVHLAQTEIKNNIRSIEGVANVEVWGNYYLMKITLDPKKLIALNINVNDIENILNQNNEILPAGRFRDLVSTSIGCSLKNKEDFENLVIKNNKSKPIFLKDIAQVELSLDDSNFRVIIQGKKGVIIAINKTSDGNPLEVSNLVRKSLVNIKKNLPLNVTISLDRDEADFIRSSLSNIKSSIIEAIILVGLVIFLFLNNARSCLIPILTIPISLIGSFAIMSLFGLSINVITLLAMVLAVGLVVDDAIVVLENIHRHMENGESVLSASVKGSREIVFAIIAMTLTLASVYIPLVFVKDTVGQIFAEFAITLAGSVIVSGITALTLSPVMCSKLLKPLIHKKPTKWEKLIETLENFYQKLLDKALHNLKYMILASLIIITSTIFIYIMIPKEIAPKEDRGIVGLFINPIAGKNLDTTEDYIKKIENIVHNNIENPGEIISFMGNWGGNVILVLPEYKNRKHSAAQIAAILRKKVQDFPSVDIHTWSLDTGLPNMENESNNDSSDLSFRVRTTGSYQLLYDNLRALETALENTGKFSKVYHDLSMNDISYDLKIDPLKLASLGFRKSEISRIVQLYFSGIRPVFFRKDGIGYDVLLKTTSDPWTINEIYLTNSNGKKISLGSFASLEPTTTPQELPHYNQMRSAKITATPINAKDMIENMKIIQAVATEILPEEIKGEFSGSTLNLTKSTNSMLILIILSLVFVYGIMAIQFESYIDPLIIMLSVPMSCFGAFLMLKIFGQSINIFTQVGVITLIGLITKHGILLVDFANKLTQKNHNLIEAAKISAKSRFRPILMTSLAMILGSLPLIISSGAGTEARKAIGYVLVGGLFFGTLLTLLMIPCFYIMIKRLTSIRN